jgi:hypothetical protein
VKHSTPGRHGLSRESEPLFVTTLNKSAQGEA